MLIPFQKGLSRRTVKSRTIGHFHILDVTKNQKKG